MDVSLLFDYYMLQTTKGAEQKRRKQSDGTIEVNVNMKTPIPTDRKKNPLQQRQTKTYRGIFIDVNAGRNNSKTCNRRWRCRYNYHEGST